MIPALLNKMLFPSAAAAVVPATLSPPTAQNVTLSNGNLTVTSVFIAFPGNQAAQVASASGKTSGKYYFETTYVTSVDGNLDFGIATPGTDYSLWGNDGTGGVVTYFIHGKIWSDGSNPGGAQLGSASEGDVIGCAVDLDNRTIWFKIVGGPDAGGDWNGDSSANPATNTNGVSVIAGAMVPTVGTAGNTGAASGNVLTANFGATAFSGTVPSGFTAGWPV